MRVWLAALGSAWATVVLATSIGVTVVPQRNGLLALAEIGMPFLLLSVVPFFVPAILPLPAALPRTRARRLRTVLRACLLGCLAFAVVRFGPVWFSLAPQDNGGMRVGVTSWNLESGEADPAAVVEELRTAPVGIVGLVELANADANPVMDDQTIRDRYPYQLLFPRDDSLGVGLLSSYPILESGASHDDPPLVWARLDLGDSQTLSVVIAHPSPGDWHTLAGTPFPVDYDATARDARVLIVRQTVDKLLANGDPLILAGDFNTTDREPAYADLSHGLLDAHLEVGEGPGSTWRPDEIKGLPFGILRIDMAFGGNGAQPMSMTADCTPRGSDHCLIQASMAVP